MADFVPKYASPVTADESNRIRELVSIVNRSLAEIQAVTADQESRIKRLEADVQRLRNGDTQPRFGTSEPRA